MAYVPYYFKRGPKIPTIVAVIIAALIGLFFIRLFSREPIPSRAERKNVKRLEVTNINANQASILWQTDQKAIGWVVYGVNDGQLGNIAYDERDLPTNKNPYRNHYVTLSNLSANQNYFFKLVSDNKLVSDTGNSGFRFKTTKPVTEFKSRNPAYGKVVGTNSSPVENAIVILKVNNAVSLSAMTKPTGEWLIPMNTLYDKNTYSGVNPTDKDTITIEIMDESRVSHITTNLSKLSPIPSTTVLGNDTNFISGSNVLSATTGVGEPPQVREIDILYPAENTIVPGNSPLIKGVAVPNTEVLVTIRSNPIITSRVKTDNAGVWSLIIPSPLSAGDHTITIQTTDRNGNAVTIERRFTIAKGGEQVLGVATGEPTLTVTLSPTLVAYITFTPTPKPPVSGGNINIPFFGAASFIIVGIGLLLVF